MEEQLRQYRAEKQSRSALDGARKPLLLGKSSKNAVVEAENSELGSTHPPVASAAPQRSIHEDPYLLETKSPEPHSSSDRYLSRATLVAKCSLWLVLMVLFVKLEFGAVFFVVSCLYLIWTNLRSGPKKVGELSAYSVFNPNFETIEGTLTAEQFEREIKFGAVAVH